MENNKRKALEEIGKDFEQQNNEISNLRHLNLIKNTNNESQRKRVNKGICPFCLNPINWDKLYTLINLHDKIINYLHKELAEIIIGSELNEEAELTEEEKKAIQKGKELIKLYKTRKIDKK